MAKEKWPGQSYTDDTDIGADDARMSLASLAVVRQGKDLYQKGFEAGDQQMMDQGHEMAEAERAKYGYSGGANGGGYISLAPTVEEPDYGEASSEYKEAMDRAIQALQGRGKFTYDPEKDPTYQQYKDQYTRLGKQAMEDSYGHAALRTGGLGGSAAMSASQQAYNGYMQGLADKIPELRQIAYQMYQDEEDRLRRDIDLYGGLDQQAWNRWNTDRGFRRGAFESDRGFDYNKAVDQWNMTRQLDRDAKADEETEYQHGQDALGWQWKQTEKDEAAAKAFAELIASGGDYSGYGRIYEQMTPEQIATLEALYKKETDQADTLFGLDVAAKQASIAATNRSNRGGSGGGGIVPAGDGMDYEGLFAAAMESGHPQSFLSQKANYQKYGFNSSSGLWADYQSWAKEAKKTAQTDQAPSGGATSPFAQNWARNPAALGLTDAALARSMDKTAQMTAGYNELSRRISNINPGVTQAQMGALVGEIEDAAKAGTINEYQAGELLKKIGF